MQSEVLMPSRLTQRMADWGQGGLAKRPSLHTKMAKRAATVELQWDPISLRSLIQLRSKNWSQPPFGYKDLRTTLKGRCGTQLCSTFQHWCPRCPSAIHLFEVVRKTHGIQRFKRLVWVHGAKNRVATMLKHRNTTAKAQNVTADWLNAVGLGLPKPWFRVGKYVISF